VQIENRPSWRALEKAGYRRTWSGLVDSGDPSDDGPSHVYVLDRPRVGRGAGPSDLSPG
jgi:aminoglycoside 6'-N-acetyltransferase